LHYNVVHITEEQRTDPIGETHVGKSLGEFEQMILFALISLGEEAYGASIRREIAARTGRDVSAGAVYTVLERLERAGKVTSRVGVPTPERGGRRRKHYQIRADGARSLRESRDRMNRMEEGLVGTLGDLATAAESP
jgi:PadR family transcriptional regulator